MIFLLNADARQKIVHELGLPPESKNVTLRFDQQGVLLMTVETYLTVEQAWALGLILRTRAEDKRKEYKVPYPEFCHHPDKCNGLSYCPRDPCCCD